MGTVVHCHKRLYDVYICIDLPNAFVGVLLECCITAEEDQRLFDEKTEHNGLPGHTTTRRQRVQTQDERQPSCRPKKQSQQPAQQYSTLFFRKSCTVTL